MFSYEDHACLCIQTRYRRKAIALRNAFGYRELFNIKRISVGCTIVSEQPIHWTTQLVLIITQLRFYSVWENIGRETGANGKTKKALISSPIYICSHSGEMAHTFCPEGNYRQ